LNLVPPTSRRSQRVIDGVRGARISSLKTKRRIISLADRACLALAVELGMPVMTGDHAWRDLDIDVEVQLFR
jgi:PIN domain nuclease of toxin-antitoxin system